MKKILGKLTYANVIATLALFIALGGASYAAFKLPKNSVGSKQIKKGAVTPAKLNTAAKAVLVGPKGATGAQGPQGLKGERGETGPPGQDATNLFAYIRDNGGAASASVHYASGVTAVSDPAGDNAYTLTFNRSIVNCVVQAVAGYGNPAGSSTVDEEAIPVISMELGNPNQTQVFFHRPAGAMIDTAFLVTAFC